MRYFGYLVILVLSLFTSIVFAEDREVSEQMLFGNLPTPVVTDAPLLLQNVVEFSCSPLLVFTGEPVQCEDMTANKTYAWLWYWGDGNHTQGKNATHTYTLPGQYTVGLSAHSAAPWKPGFLSKPRYITVESPPSITMTITQYSAEGEISNDTVTLKEAPTFLEFADIETGDITKRIDFDKNATRYEIVTRYNVESGEV